MTNAPTAVNSPVRLPVGKRELDSLVARAKANPLALRTLRCRTVAQGHFSQLNFVRDLPPQAVVEDASPNLSAETTAPNASEALLAAFGSCLSVGIHANAVAQGIPIRSLTLDLAGDINATAVWGVGKLTPHAIGFENIQVVVHIDAEAPRDVLEALVRHGTLWSPVANTLHNPVHLDVTLAPAKAHVA